MYYSECFCILIESFTYIHVINCFVNMDFLYLLLLYYLLYLAMDHEISLNQWEKNLAHSF